MLWTAEYFPPADGTKHHSISSEDLWGGGIKRQNLKPQRIKDHGVGRDLEGSTPCNTGISAKASMTDDHPTSA